MFSAESEELKPLFQQGEVFAYPTEAVFGLGCDPQNQSAVQTLLQLKQRPIAKGLILVADSWERVTEYIDEEALDEDIKQEVLDSWPGFVTWLLPKSEFAPNWITGGSNLIAIRVSAHPVIQTLCRSVSSPFVSTSANISGTDAIKERQKLEQVFKNKVIYIAGELGGADKPSLIRNALTGQIVRGN